MAHRGREIAIDISFIRGQESAKRGLEIAAAGAHNIALYGPPEPAIPCWPERSAASCRDCRSGRSSRTTGIYPRPSAGTEDHHRTSVPLAASYGFVFIARGRRRIPAAGRDNAGSSRRALPRRIAGIPVERHRCPAGAARGAQDNGSPCSRLGHLSGALHPGRSRP